MPVLHRMLVLCVALFGCDGTIADPTGTAWGPGEGGAGGGGPGEPLLCDESPHPGRSPLRRMTRVELDNTLRDLLRDDTQPAHRLMQEELGSGFSNNAEVRTVGELVAEQYLALAEDVARRASADLPGLLGCDPATGEDACVASFVESFGERAWRRPLAADERARLLGVFSASRDAWGTRTAVELVVEVMLQSPHFLYRVELPSPDVAPGEIVRLDGWQLASRLSYMLWATMPDDTLFAAAAAGELDTPAGLAEHARRMLDDPRAGDVIIRFFDEWMHLSELDDLAKDAELYPQYHDGLPPLFREETHAFVREVFENEGASFHTMLTASWSMMNAELAAFYGVEGPTGTELTRVNLDPSQRAGLLTQASFLASRAKVHETSPIHRGMFVRAGLLCGEVPPPPPGVDPIAPDPDPSLTMRERLDEHRSDPVCASCHSLMDPLGFPFEHYDAVGVWRDDEAGRPVDASGFLMETDVDGEVVGAVELAHRLAGSEQVDDCMVRQWFRYAYGRTESISRDTCSLDQLEQAFDGANYDIRELIVALTQTDAFLYTQVEEAAP
jgi:hypothetical protein